MFFILPKVCTRFPQDLVLLLRPIDLISPSSNYWAVVLYVIGSAEGSYWFYLPRIHAVYVRQLTLFLYCSFERVVYSELIMQFVSTYTRFGFTL